MNRAGTMLLFSTLRCFSIPVSRILRFHPSPEIARLERLLYNSRREPKSRERLSIEQDNFFVSFFSIFFCIISKDLSDGQRIAKYCVFAHFHRPEFVKYRVELV